MDRIVAATGLRLGAIAFAVTLLVHFSAATVRAGCGDDYIVYSNPADAARHQSHRCTGPDCKQPAQAPSHEAPVPGACKGPNCQKHAPLVPLPGPTSKTAPVLDEFALLMDDRPRPSAATERFVDQTESTIVGSGLTIYHPPR